MSPGCTYVAQLVLGKIIHKRGGLKIFLLKAKLYKGEKNFFLLIAYVKYIHLSKNKSICNRNVYTNSTFVICCKVSLLAAKYF